MRPGTQWVLGYCEVLIIIRHILVCPSSPACIPLPSFFSFFFFLIFIYLYIYLWLCGVFVSVRGLSLVVASGGHSSLRCAGLSPSRPLLLQSTGSRRAGSVVVAHGPTCSAACGIFPDQGSNPCPLHWQADSQPLRHQGSPLLLFLNTKHLILLPCHEKSNVSVKAASRCALQGEGKVLMAF